MKINLNKNIRYKKAKKKKKITGYRNVCGTYFENRFLNVVCMPEIKYEIYPSVKDVDTMVCLYRTRHDAITHVSRFVPEAPNEEIFLRSPIDHVFLRNFAAE